MHDRRSYRDVLSDTDVVAVKSGQENRRSTDDYMRDSGLPPYICKQCTDVFIFGYRPGFPPHNLHATYVMKLQDRLDQNHRDATAHHDFHKLGW